MDSSHKQNAVPAEHTTHRSSKAPVPLVTRHDTALLLLTSFVTFSGGILVSLAVLATLSPDLILLLGLLAVCSAAAVIVLLRRRAAAQAKRIKATTDSLEAESDALRLELDAQALQIRAQGTQIAALETQLQERSSSARNLPHVRGVELLGETGSEIAPPLGILLELFQGQAQVEIKKRLSGGHRNHGVYLVRSTGEAERVVKIARSGDIRAEREAQELINRFSHNNGGQYVRDVQGAGANDPGGIVYRLALLRRTANVSTFADFYRANRNSSASAALVEQLFAEVLPHSQFREVRSLPLFEEYALSQNTLDEIWEVIRRLPALGDVSRTAETAQVRVEGKLRTLRNPVRWAQTVMPGLRGMQLPVYVGVIHGDLHSGNLLVEVPGPNLWIIDFAKTRAGAHTLNDYAKLEADLKFDLLPGSPDPDYFRQALEFEERRLAPGGREEFGREEFVTNGQDDEFQKASACIGALRRMAQIQRPGEGEDLAGHFADESVLPYYIALFHSTLRTIPYVQCSDPQKVYAFLAAGLVCERISQLLD